MAYIVLNMTAGGISEAEVCSGCAHRFEDGEHMNAVASENGEPLGWYCDSCVQQWWMKDAQHYDQAGQLSQNSNHYQGYECCYSKSYPVGSLLKHFPQS